MGPVGRQVRPAGLGRTVLMDEAYDALLALILDEGLEPGTPLRIDTIAKDWGVSPTPLREALAKLENTGLVVRVPHRGYTVAPLLDDGGFRELMGARLLIEPYSARQACERDAEGTARALAESHRMMEAAAAQRAADDFRAYLQADSAFHATIARAAGNRFLSAAIDPLGAHIQRFRRFTGGRVTDTQEALAEHAAVLGAFEAADAEACEAAMRVHLEGVAHRSFGH
ncbi:GntR family transcriptional regulator [Streptomyces sp. NBC_01724]|uniref:GntR family transcriptional regulator n=1 Tax=unclassified Streptomyces TaxID=2593676 RepID=UPI002E34EA28|nr:GntR family transcriptional regulator [Streptomyces sp. NBC_01724]WTE55085.1 GntR family transcriptional regulator [Streptomyces sp. NBC_01620]WTE63159.1 GntR family transcriptional regulator [Streptomyces sp. NBC_01617]